MTKMQELGQYLFGDPATAISDIKLDRGSDPNAMPEDIAEMILAAIKDIRDGGGQEIDLTY